MPSLAQMREPMLVYEDVVAGRNLLACGEWATPGVRPVYDSWVHAQLTANWPSYTVVDRPRRYAFPVGCFHAPRQWARDPFAYVPEPVLRDAQRGRVLFIFDQSQEGNADPDLWSWFYRTCAVYGIDPARVVYLTGDARAEELNFSYCEINGIHRGIHVVSTLFNLYVTTHRLCGEGQVPPVPGRNKTALFNCLNRMPHDHRRWFLLMLLEQGLVAGNLISMGEFDSVSALPDGSRLDAALLRDVKLPLVVDRSDFNTNWFNDLNPEIYDSSWFTVVTETYVTDTQVCLGEKAFKPMLCGSPFMILSSRNSLASLRRHGFMTFPMLWDESYDHMDVVPRMRAMVSEIARVSKVTDLAWYFAAADAAVAHNQQLAWQPWEQSRDYQRILAIWQEFVA